MIIRGPFAVILLLLLFISLGANFLVAGFVAARANAPVAVATANNADVDRVVAQAVRAFPPEIQRAIVETTKAQRPQLRTRLDAVQKARQEMFDAMRTQPFNQATLDAAFADYRESTVALQKAGQAIVAQAIATAPPDVRRKIKPMPGPQPVAQPQKQPPLPQT